jgi:LPPG:FO 2-phospho-L-lactate transferase
VKVTALAGGVGGAKLLVGLERALRPDSPTVIVNTGDDAVIYGVHISPDIDIVTYWLAGLADTKRGWGIAEDSFTVVDSLAALGEPVWFRLGDRDLATCLYRTKRLSEGATLSQATEEIRRSLGVRTRILPATDDAVRTLIITTGGRTLEFQQYFVAERAAPEISEVQFDGIEDAAPALGVMDALEGSDVVLVCPSNPVLSVGPILAFPGVRDRLRMHPRVIAVTPIIRGAAVKGPAAQNLKSMGIGAEAAAVASMYADFADIFVVDSRDREQADKVAALGVRAVALDTMMTSHDASERLARELLTL